MWKEIIKILFYSIVVFPIVCLIAFLERPNDFELIGVIISYIFVVPVVIVIVIYDSKKRKNKK